MHPLDGPRRKLDRAAEHIQTFNNAVSGWYDTKPLRVITEHFDADNSAYVYQIQVPAVPIFFGIVAGDIFHNLRSALDHIAWQLAHLAPINERRAKWEDEVEFPIFLSKPTGRNAEKFNRLMSYFPNDARQIIESLQPYNTPNGKSPENSGLWILHKLSNFDKHRVITMNAGLTTIEFKAGMREDWLNDETIQVTIPMVQKNLPPPPPEMKYYLLFGRDLIGSGTSGFTIEIIPKLHNLVANIVIPRFERFFP